MRSRHPPATRRRGCRAEKQRGGKRSHFNFRLPLGLRREVDRAASSLNDERGELLRRSHLAIHALTTILAWNVNHGFLVRFTAFSQGNGIESDC